MSKVITYFSLLKQFGWKYSIFRIHYEVSKRLGFFIKKFPQKTTTNPYISLNQWREPAYQKRFFLSDYHSFVKKDFGNKEKTKNDANKIFDSNIHFFFQEWKSISKNQWNTHPVSGHNYDMKHWSKLPLYSKEHGDIKYVWEKSKFSYLLYIARNDYKHQEDHSEFVFEEIISWIDANPPNTGPQYICSQEISIRLMNWTFALFFYAKSTHLTNQKWLKIQNAIQSQIDHVYSNINFSRIAVRNNHAVTECLALYLIPTCFPFLLHANKYKKNGLNWFIKEVAYQLYADGSDNQFSFNYHRVKVQLLTWYYAVARANNEEINTIVNDRAKQSLQFLTNMMADNTNGYLPNFGANDGSIYFKLNDCDYRDYRPQLFALATLAGYTLQGFNQDVETTEDAFYFTQSLNKIPVKDNIQQQEGLITYQKGGYVLINTKDTKTLLKTPEYRDRIGQDDYLHLDIWSNQHNFLADTGSYLYNTTKKNFEYFNGCNGHNTVSINGENHLLKGPVFTWLKKPKHIYTSVNEDDDSYNIISQMKLSHPYKHKLKRTVQVKKSKKEWIITDEVEDLQKEDTLIQNWNCIKKEKQKVSINSLGENKVLNKHKKGYYSRYYGAKEKLDRVVLETQATTITTQIKINS